MLDLPQTLDCPFQQRLIELGLYRVSEICPEEQVPVMERNEPDDVAYLERIAALGRVGVIPKEEAQSIAMHEYHLLEEFYEQNHPFRTLAKKLFGLN